ncbi:MAG TPA: hypothetical protein VGR57_13300 [Ktedonobacterales bacterium]|nr:hypothetical protein [Ktedonobacterales bacterium]
MTERALPAVSAPAGTDGSLLEHYHLLVDDARELAERRDRVSSLFLSLITLILGAQGYLMAQGRNDGTTFVLIWLAAVFGAWLCQIWRRAILSFKELLNFRYFIIKRWEQQGFAEDLRYYVAEDVLYHPQEQGVDVPRLAAEYVRRRKVPLFSDTYSRLPLAGVLALVGIALVRTVTFVGPLVVSALGLHLGQ